MCPLIPVEYRYSSGSTPLMNEIVLLPSLLKVPVDSLLMKEVKILSPTTFPFALNVG